MELDDDVEVSGTSSLLVRQRSGEHCAGEHLLGKHHLHEGTSTPGKLRARVSTCGWHDVDPHGQGARTTAVSKGRVIGRKAWGLPTVV
jgi:hypothetical protein